MESVSLKSEIQCDRCNKNLSKSEIKQVIIGNNAMKPYCIDCISELKISLQKDKVAYRKWRKNPVLTWRTQILLGFALTILVGLIAFIYSLVPK